VPKVSCFSSKRLLNPPAKNLSNRSRSSPRMHCAGEAHTSSAHVLQGDWLLQSAASSTLGRQVPTSSIRTVSSCIFYSDT
jgi:hypothetical protein